MVRVDSHQHFWRLARGDYAWLTPELQPIYRDFGPDDLLPHLHRHGFDRTVLVQAAASPAETQFLLRVASTTPFVGAVVGWAELDAADAAMRLSALAQNGLSRGVRPMLQDIVDIAWMLRDELRPAVAALVASDLRFDALVKPEHLTPLLAFLQRNPALQAVVDHGAKPPIRCGWSSQWAADMGRVARQTNACCKLSGLVTEAAADWRTEDIRPYVDCLLNLFGPDRLMWGSDWPVVEMAGGYERWYETTFECLVGLTTADQAKIFGETAARFYGIGDVSDD